ncbi:MULTISPECIES: DUF488 domain-containing protein [unclassified Bifidobacterium]|uniref:DUF488 domain-containing protein n=2 Tax=Bifidobacterium TaxID=1678 RepID=UPI003A5CB6A5
MGIIRVPGFRRRMMGQVDIKRVYEQAADEDGVRILVDRLWPRGVSKERAALSGWLKDVAPSPDLRRWWHHDPDRFEDFARRYCIELDDNPALEDLLSIAREHDRTTLVYAAKDPAVNHALILRDYVRQALDKEDK